MIHLCLCYSTVIVNAHNSNFLPSSAGSSLCCVIASTSTEDHRYPTCMLPITTKLLTTGTVNAGQLWGYVMIIMIMDEQFVCVRAARRHLPGSSSSSLPSASVSALVQKKSAIKSDKLCLSLWLRAAVNGFSVRRFKAEATL